ncbi:Uma2 family endonuclease [Leptothoe sp. PORK10 BA2]|uniref:Uma2 family endonuclease n=1 Tax=Leptothoe sp. PORK10 BA2 TaxID=3110254 RepID=UPI002B20A739|nr:Uma2 family endonuclease [Leptothoe sp. PORK10 BA2]MEA5464488.1 Uma2 family endonuclease [Leptothoe sp. PORK10 BA2]
MVLQYDPKQQCLPSSAELPDSDDTPVDNELQNLVPNLLASTLALAWAAREDWFFGVDMGIYFAPKQPAIVPDGFLSLGVERFVDPQQGRLSYVLWEEDNIVPRLALEVVSKTYGGEYELKQERYIDLGIRYYAVYSPTQRRRRDRDPLEVYELVDGAYQRLWDEPVWLPEIGLGLGRAQGTHQGWEREWLYWYDAQGNKLATPEEAAIQAQAQADQAQAQADQAQAQADQAQAQVDRLAAKLRELGIDPNQV